MTVHICYLRSCFFSLFHKMSKWIFGEMSVIDLCNIDWPTQWLTKALNRASPRKVILWRYLGDHIIIFYHFRFHEVVIIPQHIPHPPPPLPLLGTWLWTVVIEEPVDFQSNSLIHSTNQFRIPRNAISVAQITSPSCCMNISL